MALKDKVIVILGNTRFDSAIRATSLFVARNLAKNNKVYFVDYPFTFKDYLTYNKSDELKLRKIKFSLFSDGVIGSDIPNLKIIIVPPVIPINFLPEGIIFRTALKANEAIIGNRIKKILKQAGVKDFIFINSFNFHYPNIARIIRPVLTVYQCVDPMIVPYDMKHGVTSELQLVEESDMVICTSKALYEEKSKINKHTYFVPNAADLSHSSKALDKDMPVHPILEKIPKPIIGYFGSIERRMDFDLLQAVINKNTDNHNPITY